MKYDYLIVGAGLFGSTVANLLNKKGKKVLVIDKRNHIAGNIYTKNENNIDIHVYGAHIFHTSDKEVWDYINTFGEFNNYINTPIANFKGRLYNMPFNMNTFTKLWHDVITPDDAKRKIEEERLELNGKEPENLEEQAISLVGRTIYETLIKGYTEKQWGKSCTELPSFIIKRLPVRYTFNNNYFNDRYQGIPVNGYTKLIENMLEGIEVRLNVDYLKNKTILDNLASKVIYTGMIDEYFNYKLGTLEYRSLRFDTEYLSYVDNYQGNAVINYTEREIPYTRMIEHKHFNYKETKGTYITREYPVTWQKGMEAYYPVNNDKNNKLYEEYKNLSLNEDKTIFGGRLGMYKYFDMDKTIREAMNLVSKLD